jgi:hypothetical protein
MSSFALFQTLLKLLSLPSQLFVPPGGGALLGRKSYTEFVDLATERVSLEPEIFLRNGFWKWNIVLAYK